VLTLLLLLTLGVCLCSALPFGWLLPRAIGENGLGPLLEQISAGQVFINSFVPPLVTATLQVLIAYLAALSIGALRPFGKRSDWILLLFSPWLFITVPPLSLAYFIAAQKAGALDTLRATFSPILFSIPALFILAIFFAGRAAQLQQERIASESPQAPDFFRHFILPSLPLAAVLWLLLLFFNGQDIFWPLLVSVSPERYSLNLTLLRLVQMFSGSHEMLAAAVTFFIVPVCALFFVCLAPFQAFYLDRLTLYAEDPSPDETAQNSEQE
jgi:ABC-type glycerol-3-phosphate transport system permease component